MYLLGARLGWAAQDDLLGMVADGDLLLVDLDPAARDRTRKLMAKYKNVPMDLADATIVAVAEQLKSRVIFTLDSDFSIYRYADRQPFTLVP
jgi:predicted nucleic acid-binding protein